MRHQEIENSIIPNCSPTRGLNFIFRRALGHKSLQSGEPNPRGRRGHLLLQDIVDQGVDNPKIHVLARLVPQVHPRRVRKPLVCDERIPAV
ncbi:unnamed protein product [Chondrus crispus]|uniref:Uncharacterized protein n=1 Tax=Chondrus crispus TaxID=2769 RepID=R7QI73_CHOCR|nr:unnamed protein product [Chondrus crispus]CDF38217.1 unnamed protein product [Chondrus crispus]|eukprot:XP_005718102.1 unnamed protein product [Chondrus crispus]